MGEHKENILDLEDISTGPKEVNSDEIIDPPIKSTDATSDFDQEVLNNY